MSWIDLSHPLGACTPVFPGDPPMRVDPVPAEPYFLTRLTFSPHCGTHMDAPLHFIPRAADIAATPIEQTCGPCAVADLRPCPAAIGPAHLEPWRGAVAAHGRVLLLTGWSVHWGSARYFEEYPVLSRAAAEWLVAAGARVVGLDTPSPDRAPFDVHPVLLGAGVAIIENLTNLEAIGAEDCELVALPLRIEGCEASPVRAVARPLPGPGRLGRE